MKTHHYISILHGEGYIQDRLVDLGYVKTEVALDTNGNEVAIGTKGSKKYNVFSKQDIKAKETNDTIPNENKGDDDGSTRLQDNDKTISRDIPTRDKSRSTYSQRERESRASDNGRDKTYKRGNFKRIREKLFPYREEAKRRSLFRYYASKINGITEEEVERYLDSIFPDSKIKDILFHGTSLVFDKFDKSFLDRQRNSKDTSDEVLDSSLAFFATDDIVNASFYSIRSKDFYLKRLRNSFNELRENPNKDPKDFFERLDNLRYFSDNFKKLADIKELTDENIDRLENFFNNAKKFFEEQSINEQEHTNTLYYAEAMLKEIERIETAFYNGTLLNHNIFGDPNKESIEFTIGRAKVEVVKYSDGIFINVDGRGYFANLNEEEPYDLNNAFNAILRLLKRSDYRYSRYGFNTEVMPVVINSQDISSKDYLNLSDNVLDEHTKQANEAFSSGKDTIEYLNVKDPVRATNYGIFNPDNIHILGSDEDIKALKEFLGRESSGETTKSNISVHKGNWTREQVEADTDRVYVFGDNIKDQLSEYEPSSTQAVIRGLENATGLVTKHDRFTNQNSYFNDSQFEEFKQELEMGIKSIKYWLSKGKEIVFPSSGIGTGKAMLATKSPKAFEYLNERLLEEFGFDNVKGELVTNPITAYKVLPLDSDSRPSNQLTQQDGNDLLVEGSEDTIPKRNKETTKSNTNEVFKYTDNNLDYEYNPTTQEIHHISRATGKRTLKTEKAIVAKVLRVYALKNRLEQKKFNYQQYSKVGNYVVNISAKVPSIVTNPDIVKPI